MDEIKMKDKPHYVINRSTYPPSCLPIDLETWEMLDITVVSDSWRRYLDPATGKVHDGSEYYKQAMNPLGGTE